MFQDNGRINWHLQREGLCAVGEAMLLDGETPGSALLNGENPGGEGDVPELHIMKEGSHMNTEHPLLWDSI